MLTVAYIFFLDFLVRTNVAEQASLLKSMTILQLIFHRIHQ